MATCEFCGREMLKDEGCSYTKVKINDKVYNRIKCGAENDLFELEEGERCHDCGALVGHYHHPFCDAEACPVCNGQLLSCDCGDITFI